MNNQTTSKTQHEQKHTPHPWYLHINKSEPTWIFTVRTEPNGKGEQIAEINKYRRTREQDGTIMSAAPDLLEALQTVLDGLAVGVFNRKGRNCQDLLDMAGVVRAAIAKATEGK